MKLNDRQNILEPVCIISEERGRRNEQRTEMIIQCESERGGEKLLCISLRELPRVYVMGQILQHAGWKREKRELREQMLVFLQEGDMCFSCGADRFVLQPGDWLMLPKGTGYDVWTEEGCRYHFIHFELCETPSLVNAEQARELRTQRMRHFQSARSTPFALPVDGHEQLLLPRHASLGAMQERVWVLLSECDMHRFDITPARKTGLDLRFAEILNLLDQEAQAMSRRPAPNVLSKILLHIHQHYARPLTLSDLSAQFSLSRQYIMALFREHVGLTVTQYITRIKLEHALELLRYSTFRVGEVAEMLGFSSTYYFCRVFRRQFGMTPTEYIRAGGKRE